MKSSGLAVIIALAVLGTARAATRDNIDLPYADDPDVIGTWVSVDFVTNASDFVPGKKQWSGDFYLVSLAFKSGGKTDFDGVTWTKGILIDKQDSTASRYEIREMAGKDYLFLEWKNGDYTIRGQKPKYYILQKQE